MAEESADEVRPIDPGHLREDIVYAAAVLEAAKKLGPAEPEPSPGIFARLMEFLSSGFGLLIIGTVLTSLLIPAYQKASEQRQAAREIMREALAEFLQYEVSIWSEFYAVFPLIHESEIDRDTYDKYMGAISEIKLDRYRAYGKVKALAIAFRSGSSEGSPIETAIFDFAVKLNQTSETIDRWLGDLYCARAICGGSGTRTVNSRAVMNDLSRTMDEITREATSVSEMMVQSIQGKDVTQSSPTVNADQEEPGADQDDVPVEPAPATAE
jgi:hypothetical protein